MRSTDGRYAVRGAGERHRGLTPKEKAIMDRWDSGQTINRIARELGRDVQRVRNLVIYYDGAAENRLHKRAMAVGSTALLRALQEARA